MDKIFETVMIDLPLAKTCRISGESLENARLLLEVQTCPLPGIYPDDPAQAMAMTSPLRVVQARDSGFVQLAHVLDQNLYRQYAFSGGGSRAYRNHLSWFASAIVDRFAKSDSILEVGCGDGWLLHELRNQGYENVLGIDPSRAASKESCDWRLSGYFPEDLPTEQRRLGRDLVVCRHVLEHIESPLAFVNALVEALNPEGELWIEVPDLECTVRRGIWSNFYQLHCNYFSAATLDRIAAEAGLRCLGGIVVDVFGGSMLRRYGRGEGEFADIPNALESVETSVNEYQRSLVGLAHKLPQGTVGYGAAERTAVMFGIAPAFAERLAGLHDGNPLLEGRYLAGTRLKIEGKSRLFDLRPPGIVLFAISNAAEILSEWKQRLNGETIVGIAGDNFPLKPLKAY